MMNHIAILLLFHSVIRNLPVFCIASNLSTRLQRALIHLVYTVKWFIVLFFAHFADIVVGNFELLPLGASY